MYYGQPVSVALELASCAQGGLTLMPQLTFRTLHVEFLSEKCMVGGRRACMGLRLHGCRLAWPRPAKRCMVTLYEWGWHGHAGHAAAMTNIQPVCTCLHPAVLPLRGSQPEAGPAPPGCVPCTGPPLAGQAGPCRAP